MELSEHAKAILALLLADSKMLEQVRRGLCQAQVAAALDDTDEQDFWAIYMDGVKGYGSYTPEELAQELADEFSDMTPQEAIDVTKED